MKKFMRSLKSLKINSKINAKLKKHKKFENSINFIYCNIELFLLTWKAVDAIDGLRMVQMDMLSSTAYLERG